MTFNIYRRREAGDVTGIGLHVYGQGGSPPTPGLGSHTSGVYLLKEFFLQFFIVGLRMVRAHRSQETFLGNIGGLVKGASQAYPYDEWRTGPATAFEHGLHHKIHDPFSALGRGEHGKAAHVLAPRPLTHD